ncbi:MAG TPA: hypothetical protein DDW27_16455 [Bacteroidales bacterium]|nr:hypothetical protein [Bacteroidales bacterium]
MKNKLLFGLAAFFFSGVILTSCKNKENDNNGIAAVSPLVLKWEQFNPLIKEFNQIDEELYKQYYPNDQAEQFLKKNIPYFNCPDKELEKTYYFRWWTYRKHIKNTPDGFVITEFLPDVPWAGKYNTISCPAGHHFYEGRWLHDQRYLQDYAYFWFRGGGALRSYSFWAANSILAFAQVHKNEPLLTDLLPDFDNNYKEWEKSHLLSDDLFWQVDDRDGMEVSIGGSGKRTTINSYMYGDARAIAEIASIAHNKELEKEYAGKAEKLKSLIITKLWDDGDQFFKTLPLDSSELKILKDHRQIKTFLGRTRNESGLIDARELHGYTPWYFSIPENNHSVAWKFIISENGFKAPFGPTTAEQSHPGFKVVYEGHACQWNGPSWPFSTSITLKSMANLLRDYKQTTITKDNLIQLLQTYSNSHRIIDERGDRICWIDENLNPFTGDWIARTMKIRQNAQPRERGKDYNHSEFCDIIISDLIGLRPSMDDRLTIEPLIPSEYWDWFCLDHVNYHNKSITVVWDKNGTKYNKGKGFSIFLNGVLVKNSRSLKKIKIKF